MFRPIHESMLRGSRFLHPSRSTCWSYAFAALWQLPRCGIFGSDHWLPPFSWGLRKISGSVTCSKQGINHLGVSWVMGVSLVSSIFMVFSTVAIQRSRGTPMTSWTPPYQPWHIWTTSSGLSFRQVVPVDQHAGRLLKSAVEQLSEDLEATGAVFAAWRFDSWPGCCCTSCVADQNREKASQLRVRIKARGGFLDVPQNHTFQ